ncbi:VOC family protein [Sporosarcina sp. ANT_H38]|uniref:VOC family protein n=1 Tax=Sporosarcina sp. ANT_H38 TaxID=2597358 RepID=UPI0011F28FF0|nr:VOC family protein [Sporosarcina sp. ANT_H38]KAA0948485.1 VOC family protein [Sporosarcina sp. ANT_H38]
MKLDHVVYFTNTEPVNIAAEQQMSGRHAVVGGRHEKWGTHNALLYTKNAYIEWLSVEKMEIAQQVDHPLTKLLLHDIEQGDGWGTICLSVDGIEKFNEEIEIKGFHTSGVLDAGRRTADGQLRKWKMLFVDQPVSNELPYPFFIEWEEPEETRFTKLRVDGTLTSDNEQLEITECTFSVDDPLRATADWAILLSQKVGDANNIVLPNVVLKFVSHNGENDRLTDVVIGQTD